MSNNIQLPHKSNERRRGSPEVDQQFNGAATMRRNIVLGATAAVEWTKQSAGYNTTVYAPTTQADTVRRVDSHTPIINVLAPVYALAGVQAEQQLGQTGGFPQTNPGDPAGNPDSVYMDVQNPNWIPGLEQVVQIGRPAVIEEMQDAA